VTDWSLLGGNPAPGSTDTFEALAEALQPIADLAQSTNDSLRVMARQGGSSVWSGSAADAFAESVRVLPMDLGELGAAHRAAVGALCDYAGTLSYLQLQAAEALACAQSAETDIGSASASRAAAASRYSEAAHRYWSYRSEVDVLEIERAAADLAGDQAASARLELEIASTTEACNAAWAEQSAAAVDIRAAQTALDSAQAQLSDAQASANRIASDRLEAAELLANRLSAAAEFSVPGRSWIDRVRHDFDSAESMFGRAFAASAHDFHLIEQADASALSYFAGRIEGDLVTNAPIIHAITHAVDRVVDDVARVVNDAAPWIEIGIIAGAMVVAVLQPETIPILLPLAGAAFEDVAEVQTATLYAETAADTAEYLSDKDMKADGRGNEVTETADLHKVGGDALGLGEQVVSGGVGKLFHIPAMDEVAKGWANGESLDLVKVTVAVGADHGMTTLEHLGEHLAGQHQ
jgi:hypothetical protein